MISPCVGICRMSDTEGVCTGCRRTIQEIINWTNFTEEQREEILSRVILELFQSEES